MLKIISAIDLQESSFGGEEAVPSPSNFSLVAPGDSCSGGVLPCVSWMVGRARLVPTGVRYPDKLRCEWTPGSAFRFFCYYRYILL